MPPSAPQWQCHSTIEPPGLVTRLSAAKTGTAHDAPVRWALLADPHVPANPAQDYHGVLPDRNTREAVADVLESGSQAALIAGDLAWAQGLPEDYARVRAVFEPLAARLPTCLTLGNHDNRSAFLAEFSRHTTNGEFGPERLVSVIEHGPIRWIVLDSLFRTDIVGGLLGMTQRSWLRQVLETTDQRPTLVVVHHPIGEADDKLLDSDRLVRIVEPFPKVKAIVTAHDHAYRVDPCGRLTHVRMPAVGMSFDAGEPQGWLEAMLSANYCRLTFHAIGKNRAGDGGVTTLTWE